MKLNNLLMAAIRRESEVGPYIQQADVISDFDTYVLCCFVLKVVEK